MNPLFVDQDNVDLTKDMPNTRELMLYPNSVSKTPRVLRFTRTDPFGFIHISIDHGKVPDKLKDQVFTSYNAAMIAAKNYYENEEKKHLEKEARTK